MMTFKFTLLIFIYFLSSTYICCTQLPLSNETSCFQQTPSINLPCLCSKDENNGTNVNCNGVTFLGDFPVLPHRYKIHSFSQSGSGLQSLEAQLFTASDIPLKKLEFSNNLLRRITERTFDGIEDTLLEINLAHNKLGDQLNSLFSTGEFLRLTQLLKLDLSGNEIKEFQAGVFNGLVNLQELRLENNFVITIPRSTLQSLKSLKSLHLQANYILDVGVHSFPNLTSLQFLNLSSNDIMEVQGEAFESLPNLETLVLSNNQIQTLNRGFLQDLTDMNCDSLRTLPRLRKLKLYGFQYLQQLDVKQCLQNLTSLDHLEIEMKDLFLKDQLQSVFSPKLDSLAVSGRRLRSISSSAFAGMLSPVIKIQIMETSIDTFTDKIFLPLPLSSKIEFDIPNNKIQRPTPEILSLLDNKQVDITVNGMGKNPIKCDCNIQSLWHWLQDKENSSFSHHQGYGMLSTLTCSEPYALQNRRVRDLKLNNFVCNENSSFESKDTTLDTSTLSTTLIIKETTVSREHPFIIFEQPVTKTPSVPTSINSASETRSTLTKVDTMIIGIVAGVVAFVCILIIIICIIRLRNSHPLYTAGPLAGPLAFRAQGKCTCLKPPPNNCTCYPMYPLPNAGRPPLLTNSMHKMLPPSMPHQPDFLTLSGHSGRLRNTPYYVTYPDSDNENK
ncbi:hypothetical protein JTE90_002845 [Oedothorax gibbosus]|uniref:LRRCT domain-containing protein n=1 Tax=Oedothorax gibbosus TaxID=931172 RepID=A0AAV6UIG5_9ARAC|nr:hypothetical protein JTE90_002845 [Oedothorax gibbosus]